MGINKINDYLKKKVPNAYTKKSIHDFANQKIAFDVSILMNKYMNYALRVMVNKTNILEEDIDRHELVRIWICAMIKALGTWLSYKILPVLVFDGTANSIKNTELNKRKESKKLKREKIASLTEQIRADPLTNAGLIKDLNQALMNCIEIYPEDKLLFKNVAESIGIPCLTATAEAEQLCAMLCHDGYTSACYSIDSDLLAYLCPLIINKISDEMLVDEDGYQDLQFECIEVKIILEELQLTKEMFIDWCIMCGCDYNSHIKGLGSERCYKLIQKYKSIDDLVIKQDTLCLNHLECRNAFTKIDAEQLVADGDLHNLKMKPYDTIYSEYTKAQSYNIKLYYKDLQ